MEELTPGRRVVEGVIFDSEEEVTPVILINGPVRPPTKVSFPLLSACAPTSQTFALAVLLS